MPASLPLLWEYLGAELQPHRHMLGGNCYVQGQLPLNPDVQGHPSDIRKCLPVRFNGEDHTLLAAVDPLANSAPTTEDGIDLDK